MKIKDLNWIENKGPEKELKDVSHKKVFYYSGNFFIKANFSYAFEESGRLNPCVCLESGEVFMLDKQTKVTEMRKAKLSFKKSKEELS